MKPSCDDDVGYGKPPVSTRFKKGKSGNGSGRPKQRLTVLEELAKALTKRIKLPDGTKVTKLEAGFRNLRTKALAGDQAASSLMELVIATFQADPAANPIIMHIMESDVEHFDPP